MPTVVATASYTYMMDAGEPVGFEVMLSVYDGGGGAGATEYVNVISIDPTYADYWTDQAASSTGLKNPMTGNYIRHPADVYDPEGITATWTQAISAAAGTPTQFVLRARFGSTSGLIEVQVESTQLDDPSNSASLNAASTTLLTVPIPTPSEL